VDHYLAQGGEAEIISITGKDGKFYPAQLKRLKNPTKKQLDTTLARAGLSDCKPFLP
jgi:hypothetical protein